jgi:hypothetical protein
VLIGIGATERLMNDKHTKRPYQKPEIRKVTLKPEEAVLGSCKNPSGGVGGPGQATCSTPSSCSSLGS